MRVINATNNALRLLLTISLIQRYITRLGVEKTVLVVLLGIGQRVVHLHGRSCDRVQVVEDEQVRLSSQQLSKHGLLGIKAEGLEIGEVSDFTQQLLANGDHDLLAI